MNDEGSGNWDPADPMVGTPMIGIGDVEAEIASEEYHVFSGRVTVCALTLKNGHIVTGVNYGTLDPVKLNLRAGREMAREAAARKVWPLLGFMVRQRLMGG